MRKEAFENQRELGSVAAENATAQPSLATLRAYLEKCLPSESDFEGFCIDYFTAIQKRFSSGMDRTSKTNLLLTCAEPDEIFKALCARCPSLLTARIPTTKATLIGASRTDVRFLVLWSLLLGAAVVAGLTVSAIVRQHRPEPLSVDMPSLDGSSQNPSMAQTTIQDALARPTPLHTDGPAQRAVAIPVVLEILANDGDEVRLVGNGVNKRAVATYKVIPSDERRTLLDVPRAFLAQPLSAGHYTVQCSNRSATSETIYIDISDKQTHYEIKTTCRYR